LYPYLGLGIGLGVAAVALGVYAVAMRTRYHYTSSLTCPNCQRSFEYDWVPLASFSAVRLGRSRYLQCPLCHQWATFNVLGTRTGAEPHTHS